MDVNNTACEIIDKHQCLKQVTFLKHAKCLKKLRYHSHIGIVAHHHIILTCNSATSDLTAPRQRPYFRTE
jgi:hypothetical protein